MLADSIPLSHCFFCCYMVLSLQKLTIYIKKTYMKLLIKNFLIIMCLFISLNGVFCPFCQKEFSAFMPYGVTRRTNAQCSQCKLMERHRHLWLFLINNTSLFTKSHKLLHCAPERALYSLFATMKNINYHPIDLSPAPWGDRIKKADLLTLPFGNNSFDAILCNHVLEHIPDDAKAMAELYRVLKPNGWAIIMVPLYKHLSKTFEDFSVTSPEERLRLFDQHDHVRKYALDIKDRLKKAGFEVTTYLLDSMPEDKRAYYGLDGYDKDTRKNAGRGADIFYCVKK